MKWFCLAFRIGRGTLIYMLGGSLFFAVAGLVESMGAGCVMALFVFPSNKEIAFWIVTGALRSGALVGFFGGLLAFMGAGFTQTSRAEFRYHHLQNRYIPRDAAFWNCVRSALWSSATFAIAGAATGSFVAVLWLVFNAPQNPLTQPLNYELIFVVTGANIGFLTAFLIGIFVGALAPDAVQTARQRVEEWREKSLRIKRQARATLKGCSE